MFSNIFFLSLEQDRIDLYGENHEQLESVWRRAWGTWAQLHVHEGESGAEVTEHVSRGEYEKMLGVITVITQRALMIYCLIHNWRLLTLLTAL